MHNRTLSVGQQGMQGISVRVLVGRIPIATHGKRIKRHGELHEAPSRSLHLYLAMKSEEGRTAVSAVAYATPHGECTYTLGKERRREGGALYG